MPVYSKRPNPSAESDAALSMHPPLMRRLLSYRGITDAASAEVFLNPDYDKHTHDPFLLKDAKKAAERIIRAIEGNERIMIYGDYDADGIPGGVVFHDFLKKIGYSNFGNYFPHRYDEGFGFHARAVEGFAKDGVKLIVTIDCGTADHDAVDTANSLGIDVIVTDHHLPPEAGLPKAYAVVNHKQEGCTYPDPILCGSGVVYKLIQAVLKSKDWGLKPGSEKWFLDMVGFATMADMVPLLGENRVLAHYGLKVLRKTPRLGLLKLLDKARVDKSNLTEDDIGFTIGPRVNAASRMGKPSEAFELLTSSDEAHAEMMADHLVGLNDERKALAAVMSKEAKKTIKERHANRGKGKIIVLGNPNWRPALVGPVANNLMESEGVPVFLWGRGEGTEIRGSCRAPAGFSLPKIMAAAKDGVFLAFGGHAQSGGFEVSHDHIHTLEEELSAAYEKVMAEGVPELPPVPIDATLTLDDVDWKTYSVIEKLAPFGTGNPKPLFLFERVTVDGVKLFGKEKNHLELVFRKGDGTKVTAIAFFKTDQDFAGKAARGAVVDLVATFEKSTFRNFPELRLRIVDIL